MFNFKAYFYGNDVYINEKYRYSSNEILISYLNDKCIKYILDSDFVYELKRYKRCLTISPYMDHDDFSRYNDNVYAATDLLEKINTIIFSLPPFDKTLGYSVIKLDDILNGYDRFFEDGLDSMDYSLGRVDEDFINEYGYGEKDDYDHYSLRLSRFELLPLDKDDLADEDVADDLRELNSSIDSFFDIYIDFLTAYLQVHQTYKPFIRDWLNRNEAFPTSDETARYFTEFNRSKGLNRAYKAHYARYMKKKMTVVEFEEWSRFA